MLETARYRHLTTKHLTGNGIDVGSGGEPVVPTAIQFELSRTRDYGQREMPEGIEWEGDGLNLPFRDGTLDYVYSSHLLEDFADWRPALAEWTRVLKPGGNLVLLLPDRERWQRALANGQPPNLAHKHEGRVGELSAYAAEFGWDVIEDRLTDLDPADYSILFVARKRFDAPAIGRPAQDVVTFAHSGDLGDVIAHMPTMRALTLKEGADREAEIVLYRQPAQDARRVRQPFDVTRAHNLGRLLADQPWVRRWRFIDYPLKPGSVMYDFADWRIWYTAETDGRGNLALSACEHYGVDPAVCESKWIEAAPKPITNGHRKLGIVVCRSHRYRDPEFPWAELAEKFRHHSVVIGGESENEELAGMYGFGAYIKTDTLAEAASVVAGADVVITNQTSTFWLAEGLKKPAIIMERFEGAPNCDFANRPGTLSDRDAILAWLDAYKLPSEETFKPVRPPRIAGVRAPEPVPA